MHYHDDTYLEIVSVSCMWCMNNIYPAFIVHVLMFVSGVMNVVLCSRCLLMTISYKCYAFVESKTCCLVFLALYCVFSCFTSLLQQRIS